MKFGVRECADVVLRAKANQKIGNRIFYKNEPVCYFDTLKTSTFEGAATTVYAQGGRGNARLMSWDGERTVTFTMEDALISPIGLAILTGAGLIEGSEQPIIQHITETCKVGTGGKITLKNIPYVPSGDKRTIYIMKTKNGEVDSEVALGVVDTEESSGNVVKIAGAGDISGYTSPGDVVLQENDIVLVDYYTQKGAGNMQIDITPDKFGGTFYLEASTLWRDQATGQDLPAEFIIPSCKVQSNFSFTLASSGDPSSFTFTMDAFPDFTRWDGEKKVLASIQVIGASQTQDELLRPHTNASPQHDADANGLIVRKVDPANIATVTLKEGATTLRVIEVEKNAYISEPVLTDSNGDLVNDYIWMTAASGGDPVIFPAKITADITYYKGDNRD